MIEGNTPAERKLGAIESELAFIESELRVILDHLARLREDEF